MLTDNFFGHRLRLFFDQCQLESFAIDVSRNYFLVDIDRDYFSAKTILTSGDDVFLLTLVMTIFLVDIDYDILTNFDRDYFFTGVNNPS